MIDKAREKVYILIFDGWQLKPDHPSNFYSRRFSPYFDTIFHRYRSAPVIRESHVEPQKTFYLGSIVPRADYQIKELLKRGKFWELTSLQALRDYSNANQARLWIIFPDDEQARALGNLSRSGFNKLGIVSPNLHTDHFYPPALDYRFFNFNQFTRENLVEPHDNVIYFADCADWSRFYQLVKKQSSRPLNYYTITDEQEIGYFSTLLDNFEQQDLRHLMRENGLRVNEVWFEPNRVTEYPHNPSDVVIGYLPESYLNLSLSPLIIRERLQLLTAAIDHLLMIKGLVILTSRWGIKDQTLKSELLPLVICDNRTENYRQKSIVEHWLDHQSTLADVAPTILDRLGIIPHSSMTGRSLMPKLYPETKIGEHSQLGLRLPELTSRYTF